MHPVVRERDIVSIGRGKALDRINPMRGECALYSLPTLGPAIEVDADFQRE
jgi:hypothetical protein